MKDLREKIINAESRYFDEALIEKFVQIAETHAKDEAIGFRKFIRDFYLKNDVKVSIETTDEELYEIYQQQKKKL